MNFRQLEAYRAIMVAGTVTQAARMLRVSQPAVSRLLAQLEDTVGFALFQRIKGRLVPTHEGMNLYREVEKAFLGLDKITERAKEIRELRSGHLQITSLPALSIGLLPKVIERFVCDRPEVNVSLQVCSTPRVLEWMAAQQSDLGFAAEPVDDPAYDIEYLSVDCVTVLPPGHRLQSKEVITPADLQEESFVSLGRDHRTRFRIDAAFEAARVQRHMRFETQLTVTVCSFVLQGLGVSIVDPVTASDYADRGLVVRPFSEAIPFDFGIIYSAFRPRSQLAEEFVTELRACVQEIGIVVQPQRDNTR
jgi:DNA-binding transcriptional LysR family regulator